MSKLFHVSVVQQRDVFSSNNLIFFLKKKSPLYFTCKFYPTPLLVIIIATFHFVTVDCSFRLRSYLFVYRNSSNSCITKCILVSYWYRNWAGICSKQYVQMHKIESYSVEFLFCPALLAEPCITKQQGSYACLSASIIEPGGGRTYVFKPVWGKVVLCLSPFMDTQALYFYFKES